MKPNLLSDSWTIAVKEWREWRGDRARLGWVALSALIIVWSVVAFQLLGRLDGGLLIVPIVSATLPLTLAGVMIIDAIAGERERQTLETLLASRLSNRVIVFGKIVAVTGAGWVLLLLGMAPALLQPIVAPAPGDSALQAASVAGALLTISALGVVLVVAAGALIALYTVSSRFALLLTIAFVGSVVLGAIGVAFWWAAQAELQGGSAMSLLTVLGGSLALLDAVLLGWLLLSAHRDRLLAIG